jgi:metallophosphoesterase superfamily enzyme
VSGWQKWNIVGMYLPPSEEDDSTIEYIQAAVMNERTLPLILLGDLNIYLKKKLEETENDVKWRHSK